MVNYIHRSVAQLVACSVRDAEVVGSSPATPTNKKYCHIIHANLHQKIFKIG